MWIVIGMLSGSLITSSHDTREACEGRAVMLREMKAEARCVPLREGRGATFWNGGSITLPNTGSGTIFCGTDLSCTPGPR